ncbi:hypothetical protein TKK_0004812 [Trichogramma kaykai]
MYGFKDYSINVWASTNFAKSFGTIFGRRDADELRTVSSLDNAKAEPNAWISAEERQMRLRGNPSKRPKIRLSPDESDRLANKTI